MNSVHVLIDTAFGVGLCIGILVGFVFSLVVKIWVSEGESGPRDRNGNDPFLCVWRAKRTTEAESVSSQRHDTDVRPVNGGRLEGADSDCGEAVPPGIASRWPPVHIGRVSVAEAETVASCKRPGRNDSAHVETGH